MTRSPRRRTLVVLLTALTACLAGLTVAVVAFGQSTSDYYDTTVPTGDYTSTTPAKSTPTSQYTVTTPATTVPAGGAGVPSGGSSTPRVPSRAHRAPSAPSTTTPHVSKATRPGPTHLAFTGGEPLLVGGAGAGLMLAAVALQLRRRRSSGPLA